MTELKDFIIEDGVLKEYVGSESRVVVPEGITKIGSEAFACLDVEEVILPIGVKTLGSGIFRACHSLKRIEIPEGVTVLPWSAFAYCDALEELILPDTIRKYEYGCFDGCDSLKFNVVGGVNYLGNEKNPYVVVFSATDEVPEECNIMAGARLICENVFNGCQTIKRLTLPDGLATISSFAFYHCDKLESVTFGEGLLEIGSAAFEFSNLKTVVLPDGIERIGFSAFSRLDNIVLPDTLKTVGKGTVALHDDGAAIEYNGCLYIGSSKNPFSCLYKAKSKDITECEVHKDTKIILSCAFDGTKIKRVELPEGLCQIGDEAFRNCEFLKEITIPDGTLEIGDAAFISAGLKTVNLPKTELKIGSNAFVCCDSLKTVELDRCTVWDNAFSSSGLRSVVATENAKLYGDYLFAGCSKLKKITLTQKQYDKFYGKTDVFEGCRKIKFIISDEK